MIVGETDFGTCRDVLNVSEAAEFWLEQQPSQNGWFSSSELREFELCQMPFQTYSDDDETVESVNLDDCEPIGTITTDISAEGQRIINVRRTGDGDGDGDGIREIDFVGPRTWRLVQRQR